MPDDAIGADSESRPAFAAPPFAAGHVEREAPSMRTHPQPISSPSVHAAEEK